MVNNIKTLLIFALTLIFQSYSAVAHPGHGFSDSFGIINGLIHPLTSLDHVIAMLAVGFLISQHTGKIKIACSAFILSMLAGTGLTLAAIEIPHAEHLMVFLAITIAAGLIFAPYIPRLLSGLVIVVFAVLHGYTHAYDIWLDEDSISFTAGFASTTLALLALGIAGAALVKHFIYQYQCTN
ncbi:HupE/UreJ family protein [Methylomonas rhizoryzae]|uniref:HupE/UreJ family protein n=1 Tax=Methylomonas rhizoryzae TaxID=2608981 RepID=UPI001231E367|nr:HupE/UreJ family protein [Methylomonas rhizoryzae]